MNKGLLSSNKIPIGKNKTSSNFKKLSFAKNAQDFTETVQ